MIYCVRAAAKEATERGLMQEAERHTWEAYELPLYNRSRLVRQCVYNMRVYASTYMHTYIELYLGVCAYLYIYAF